MRPVRIYMLPRALDADGIATAQTLGGAASVTLDGALVTDGVAIIKQTGTDSAGRPYSLHGQQVTIASVGNDSGVTFTVTGTDQDGQTITATVTGANAGTANVGGYWSTITAVSSSGATAADITVGITTLSSSPTVPLDIYNAAGCALGVILSGTATYTVQHTFQDINAQAWRDGYSWDAVDGTWLNHDSSDLVAATASADGNYAFIPMATRCIVTAWTSGTVEYDVLTNRAF